jgi:DNA-binding MarR family transcriptional regulator
LAPERETVELLVQAARFFHYEDNRPGLRDREWMVLRFLSRANRFSRTPSAVATFIGTTRATATQILKILEAKSYLARRTSRQDRRSVTLAVTSQGERLLTQRDPLNGLLNAIAALVPEECLRLRDSLGKILNQIDAADHWPSAGVCRNCMFLAEAGARRTLTGRARTSTGLQCRLHRAPIAADEVELLCTSFERAVDRPKPGEPAPESGS